MRPEISSRTILDVDLGSDFKTCANQSHMIPLPSYSEIAESLKKGAISEAEEQILKLCQAALDLQEENLALRDEIKQLREEKTIGVSLELSEGAYWRLEDGERVGPFCPYCYDAHHRLAQLLDGSRYVAKTRWICRECNRVYD